MLTINKVINDLNKSIQEYTFINKNNDDEKLVKAYIMFKKYKNARDNMNTRTPKYVLKKIDMAARYIVENVIMIAK